MAGRGRPPKKVEEPVLQSKEDKKEVGNKKSEKEVVKKENVEEIKNEDPIKKDIKELINENVKEVKEDIKKQKPNKPNKKDEDDLSSIEEIYGELLSLTEDDDHFFPSGSLIVDSVLSNGRGIPLGKFISINSESSIGKTTLCLHIARNCCAQGYRCLYIDTECGLNRSQLDSFSMLPFVQNRTFIPKYIRTYRELDDLLNTVIKKDNKLKFIFIDSLTDLIPDQYLKNNISDINQPALEAVMQSRILKKYKQPLSNAGVTVFFILQNRTKIDMSYGQQTTVQAAGGKAVQYHMDITLELIKKDYLTKTIKGHDKPIPYGTECFIKSNKNRYAPPMIPMLIHIIFGRGVSNSGAIATALILNGVAKTPSKMKILIEYEGEMKEFIGKPKFENFIKEHLDYYKQVVEEKCGGIKLLRDEDSIQPILYTTSDNDVEEDTEEIECDNISD